MAIKPADNETFYREVDEELRREQMTHAWRRYGPLAVVAVILLLAAIGGWIWWEQQRHVKAGEQGETLNAVFDDVQAGKLDTVTPRLDQLAKDGAPGYRAAALLTKADLAIQTGNDSAAIAAFKTVAADESLAQPYRDLALVRQTALEFDTLPPATVIARLKPLAVAGNPWFGSAGELVALAHIKAGKPQLAAPVFAAMAKDQGVPQSIRSRAVQMASALGTDAVQQASGPAAATKEVTQ